MGGVVQDDRDVDGKGDFDGALFSSVFPTTLVQLVKHLKDVPRMNNLARWTGWLVLV